MGYWVSGLVFTLLLVCMPIIVVPSKNSKEDSSNPHCSRDQLLKVAERSDNVGKNPLLSNQPSTRNNVNFSDTINHSRFQIGSSSSLNAPNKRNVTFEGGVPLKVTLSDEQKDFLHHIESELLSKRKMYEWSLLSVPIQELDTLCAKLWLKHDPGIEKKNKYTVPTCKAKKRPVFQRGGEKCTGVYKYITEINDPHYKADFVRCDCAIVFSNWKGNKRAVKKTKIYFYLMKYSENEYCIMSTEPRTSPRLVYVINFFKI